MKSSNTFSPEAIAEICNGAKNIADRHRKYSEAIGSEIELIDRLLAHHLSGVPDAQIELVAVGRRLTALLDTGGPR